jgi:Family of unknown function (DUF5519)
MHSFAPADFWESSWKAVASGTRTCNLQTQRHLDLRFLSQPSGEAPLRGVVSLYSVGAIRPSLGRPVTRRGGLLPSHPWRVTTRLPSVARSKRTARAPTPNTVWKRNSGCFCILGLASRRRFPPEIEPNPGAGPEISVLVFYENWGFVSSKPYEGTGQIPCFRTICGAPLRATLRVQEQPAKEKDHMNDELLEMVEREVLSWPGVSKERGGSSRGQGGFRVPPAIVYRFGRRQIGHIHTTGVADLTFPR